MATNKEKIERFDAVQAQCNKQALALYDLVNGRFSMGERVHLKDISPEEYGSMVVRLSNRAMPLFLVEQHLSIKQGKSTDVWTESEVEDMYRLNPQSVYVQAVYRASRALLAKYNTVQRSFPVAENFDVRN